MNLSGLSYGLKQLSFAALLVLFSVIGSTDEYTRQTLLKNLLFNFFIIYVATYIWALIRKEMTTRQEANQPHENQAQ